MKTLFAWLQLFRLPNVFTVPGDVLMAAFLLHQAEHSINRLPLFFAVLATCLFYLGGLILNDIMDLKEDLQERPHRPIPSGQISRSHAFIAMFLLFAAALALCWFAGQAVWIVGLALLGFILLYDLGMKRIVVLGPAMMGFCRATAIVMGAAACGETFRLSWSTFILAETYLLYFSLITILARYETKASAPRILSALPIIMLLNGLLLLLNFNDNKTQMDLILYIALACIGLGQGIEVSRKIFSTRSVSPQQIGSLIHLILWIQAAVIAYAGQWPVAFIILCFIPISRLLRRKLYAS